MSALDFMTEPPTVLNNSAMNVTEGCASIADENGDLLFYTDGQTVWNKSHTIMANGIGLLGNNTSSQSSLIIRGPGSMSLYYLFTLQGMGGTSGLNYSIIDISLASGQGSVVVKNASLYNAPCAELLAGTKHCNGIDHWVVVHERNSSSHRAYLLNSSGVSSNPVIASIGPVTSSVWWGGQMNFSPAGDKLAIAAGPDPAIASMQLYDFDNTTGQLSNYQQLLSVPLTGCEFSNDGSKLYGIHYTGKYFQWDLCAGGGTAIATSQYSFNSSTGNNSLMQLAPNGKIYIAKPFPAIPFFDVIQYPDSAGSKCGYLPAGQSIGNNNSTWSIPNFIKTYKPVLDTFNYKLSPAQGCYAVSFTAAPGPSVSCAAAKNFSLTGISWNFGDPASGSTNVAGGQQPVHIYSSAGTFTAMQIFHYKCSADTVKRVITIPPPFVSLSWQPGCDSSGSAATVSVSGSPGPYSYTWQPGAYTSSMVSNLADGSYTVTIYEHALGCFITRTLAAVNNKPPVVKILPSSDFSLCTGSQSLLIAQGDATSYSWSPAVGLSTAEGSTVLAFPSSSQDYTVVGSLNSCTSLATVSVNVLQLPPALAVAEKTLLCLSDTLKLSGAGGLSYNWIGPGNSFYSGQVWKRVISDVFAVGKYSLTVQDGNGCEGITTIDILMASAADGELKGQLSGCAPFCADYHFVPNSTTSAIFSEWQVSSKTYGDNFDHCFAEAGRYKIFGTVYDSLSTCRRKKEYDVLVYSRPVTDFNYLPKKPVENFDEVVFEASTYTEENVKFSWYFSDDRSLNTNGYQVYRSYPESGTYPVVLVSKNQWDCTDTIIKVLTVEPASSVYMPNAFTPNDDGRNDVLLPVTRGVKSYTLKIFNRWGELVYETSGSGNGWDGSFRGKPCKQDVYLWQIEIQAGDGNRSIKSGHVSLIR